MFTDADADVIAEAIRRVVLTGVVKLRRDYPVNDGDFLLQLVAKHA